MNTSGRPVLRLLGLLAPHGRRFLPAVGAAVAAELAAVALMGTAAWLIASAAGRPELSALTLAIVAVRGLALSRGLLRYLDRLLGHDAVLAAVAGLRARVFRSLIPLAPSGTRTFRGGDLLVRLVDDVDAAQDLLLRCLLPAAVAAVVGAAAVGTSALLLPAAGGILLAGLVLTGIVVPAVVYATGRRGGARERLRGELAAHAVDLTRGSADLLAFGAVEDHLAHTRELAEDIARRERRGAFRTGLATAVTLLVQGTTTVAVALVALRAVTAGALSEVLLVVLAVLALATFEVVAGLPEAARRFVEVQASAGRLVELMDAAAPVTEPVAPRPLVDPAGRIEVEDLHARYPGAPAPALAGIDLRLEPGRRVAIVGASGSGKSTLLAVLMRFLDPEAGTVRIDGHDVRDLSGDAVRAAVSGVTQDAHVFHADVRANLLLARPDATDEQLRAAAAGARLLTWIESRPDGWATVLGEGGTAMSGGQRQRLLLARALLADPAVLLLDEPTEGLDAETADAVLGDLLGATRDRTTVLVTHRPAGLDAVDEVIVLDAGRVAMRGTHRDLLEVPGYPGAVLAAV